jgi:hypothetical protein
MGAVKQQWIEDMERDEADSLSDQPCARCSDYLTKEQKAAGQGLCGYCQHLFDKED